MRRRWRRKRGMNGAQLMSLRRKRHAWRGGGVGWGGGGMGECRPWWEGWRGGSSRESGVKRMALDVQPLSRVRQAVMVLLMLGLLVGSLGFAQVLVARQGRRPVVVVS